MSVTSSLIHTLEPDQASTKRHLVEFTGGALKRRYIANNSSYWYGTVSKSSHRQDCIREAAVALGHKEPPKIREVYFNHLYSRAAWQHNNLFVRRKLQVWAREPTHLYCRNPSTLKKEVHNASATLIFCAHVSIRTL